jgi:hypothetical protein
MHEYLAGFDRDEGVLFIGRAQEKAGVFRTGKRRDAAGLRYPWIVRATAMVKRQAVKAGIGFTALGNGFATCDDPTAVQAGRRWHQGSEGSAHARCWPSSPGKAPAI